MRRSLAPLLTLLAAACGGLPRFSAPAPAGSLACAVREAEELGYQKMGGEVEEGVVRLAKRTLPPPARQEPQPTRPVGPVVAQQVEDPPVDATIRISERRGRLDIAIVAEREPDPATDRAGDASDDAQRILLQCASPLP